MDIGTTGTKGIQLNAKSFNLLSPSLLIRFITFFSPVFVMFTAISSSFASNNLKGLIFFLFTVAVCILREIIYTFSGGTKKSYDEKICNYVNFGDSYSIALLNPFMLSFIFMYFAVPMYTYNTQNIIFLSLIIAWFYADVYIKKTYKCVTNNTELFSNIFGGLIFGWLITTMMIGGGSQKYLFFNEMSSNKEVCTQPDTQTFKCKDYKNGELIGNL